MIRMTLEQAAHVLDLPTPSAALEFQGISIDTRTLVPGNLFMAIVGSRVDGHDLLADAEQKGAVAALVSRHVESSPLPQLLVNDIYLSLGKLAAAWRNKFSIPFFAVTGSNGKTTLKNMIAAIMTAACQDRPELVLATQGTLNNHLGLPLTLIQLNEAHRYAVIEMGMNHFGEIAYLTKLTRPKVAVITNAATAHLEALGNVAGVAQAKGEIFQGLPPNGTAILNYDDAFFNYWRTQIGARSYLTFGFHPDADISLDQPAGAPTAGLEIRTPKGNVNIKMPLLGKHNVLNTLAATAAAMAVGTDLAAIKAGLEKVAPAKGRLQLHALANGVKIIDDSYNANPCSLQAAVETLASFTGKKILVLGDMKELGTDAKTLHDRAGEKIRQAGIDYLFTYGELSANTSQTFGEGAYHFNEQNKLVNALKPFLYNQTTILIKGSRSMRMEKVVADLIQ